MSSRTSRSTCSLQLSDLSLLHAATSIRCASNQPGIVDAALWEALASFSIFSIRSGSRKTGYDSERVVDEGELSWKRD